MRTEDIFTKRGKLRRNLVFDTGYSRKVLLWLAANEGHRWYDRAYGPVASAHVEPRKLDLKIRMLRKTLMAVAA